jgi:hypothetical protein
MHDFWWVGPLISLVVVGIGGLVWWGKIGAKVEHLEKTVEKAVMTDYCDNCQKAWGTQSTNLENHIKLLEQRLDQAFSYIGQRIDTILLNIKKD